MSPIHSYYMVESPIGFCLGAHQMTVLHWILYCHLADGLCCDKLCEDVYTLILTAVMEEYS